MENSYKYTVAGHTFRIILPDGFTDGKYLEQYSSFASDAADPLFTLRVSLADNLSDVAGGAVKDIFNDEPPYFWLFDRTDAREGMYPWFFAFSYHKSRPDCVLHASEDFTDAVVYVPSAEACRLVSFALNNAVMLLYTFTTAFHDTLLVHASLISYKGGGYMFLGRSGTGKSTHARLWLENITGSELLNDDNPVIRVVDGEVFVYGSPWSGKTPCYKNEYVPLRAVVRLSQAPFNRIAAQSPLHAYASLMPSCSCMRWDPASTEALHKTVEKVVMSVPGWHLECLPDTDAARTSCAACVPVENDSSAL